MNDFDKISEELGGFFKLRGYQESTIKLYIHWLIELFKYYPSTNPPDISEAQVNSYIIILVNRKLSYSSINQFFQSADFFYNHIHKKDYRFNKKLLPKKIEIKIDSLTQEQIFLIIDNIHNVKHKAIVALLYSCGLELSELINIKISDVKSKQKPPIILIRNTDSKTPRKAILSEKVLEMLRNYWVQSKPQNWLFEGQNDGSQYSLTSARKVVENAFENVGFTLDYEVKVLRKSYIKHLVELGVPLIVVMQHIGIKSFESIDRYTKMIHGECDVTFSPFDKVIGKSEIITPEIIDLEKIVFTLQNKDEKDYLTEAISCFRVGALRAGIVFSWVACTRYIQNKCIDKGYKTINEALHRINPGAKQIRNLDDFETIKDLTLLSVAFELGVLSKHHKSQLDNHLDLRNHCGHPSSYTPEINKAKAFVEDIVNLMKK